MQNVTITFLENNVPCFIVVVLGRMVDNSNALLSLLVFMQRALIVDSSFRSINMPGLWSLSLTQLPSVTKSTTPITHFFISPFSKVVLPNQLKHKTPLVKFQLFATYSNMDLRESITSQNDVSFMLANHVFSKEVKGDSNLVFSPLSIQLVLALIAAGSSGPTQDQLLRFLKSKSIDELNSLYSHLVNVVFVDGSPNGGPRLSVANGVWIDQTLSLKSSFKQVLDNVYKAASESVDFQNKAAEVSNQVNQWAKLKTNDLITEILPRDAVDEYTRLILANALYFKGAWDQKFNVAETKDHEYHLLNGGFIRAPFMTSKTKQYVAAYDGFKVLRLPYKQGTDTRHFSMYVILPDAHDGLPALLDKISSTPGFLNHCVPFEQVKVREYLIPKFKITFAFQGSNVLKGLGLTLPFSGGGLTEMVDIPSPEKLVVSEIFHKSFIEVNEEGTEAAAVTASVLENRKGTRLCCRSSILVPYKRRIYKCRVIHRERAESCC